MTKVSVVSLTDTGRALAARLQPLLPEAQYLHRPRPFGQTLQNRFEAGHRLVLICATGIAVRALAPVLGNKQRDPAVLVMDEHGRFVIPLLSGHEGGANAWGRWLSDRLGAQCVITGARTYAYPVLIAGMGCERHCPRENLAELMDETLAQHGMDHRDLTAIVSIELKRDEPGLIALAEERHLPVYFYPAMTLLQYTEQLSHKSALVFRETGCYGVAEAAALAHAERVAGQPAELIIPKRKHARATFAVARAFSETEKP